MKVVFLATLLAAAPAFGEGTPVLPTPADVAGVAAGDVLNVRERASASAPVIGTLAPDAKGVEVVSISGGWMKVNAGERTGWASARFLRPRADTWQPGAIPPTLRCAGTEPFWSLIPAPGSARFSTPEGDRDLPGIRIMDRGIPGDPRRVLTGDGLVAVIAPAQCSDGMSDRAFGLDATMVLGTGASQKMYSGCCSIAASGE